MYPYVQFVPTASKTAQIAFGTAVGLRQVLGMQDGTKNLETFLTAAPEGTPILITGHSLGGCLASALVPCVADWVGNTSTVFVYTIAAPSPGNEDFASYYNALFNQSGHSTAFRFFNSLDVVPNAWASLNTVETYYPPLVPCSSDISKIIDRAETAVGGKYRQLGELAAGSAVELPGTIITPSAAPRGRMELNPFENALFLWEAGRSTTCLHDVPGVAADALDGSGGRQGQAGACCVGKVSKARGFAPSRPYCAANYYVRYAVRIASLPLRARIASGYSSSR